MQSKILQISTCGENTLNTLASDDIIALLHAYPLW